MPRASKLRGLVKPWAVRRSTWSRLLVPSILPLEARSLWCQARNLVGPGDDGVDGVVVLGQLAGLVEVAEPSQGLEGAVVVVGEVEAVEFLQGLPAGPQAGVGVEQLVEAGPVGVGEGVTASQQREPGPEHFGVEGGLGAFRAALDVAADLGEPGREPSDDMEAVQHMAGGPEVGADGGLVGLGAVADDDLDSLAPSVALLHQKR